MSPFVTWSVINLYTSPEHLSPHELVTHDRRRPQSNPACVTESISPRRDESTTEPRLLLRMPKLLSVILRRKHQQGLERIMNENCIHSTWKPMLAQRMKPKCVDISSPLPLTSEINLSAVHQKQCDRWFGRGCWSQLDLMSSYAADKLTNKQRCTSWVVGVLTPENM